MGLLHDRYRVLHHESGPYPHPAYGYVNQRGLLPSASSSRRWRTIMSYATQCDDDGFFCSRLLRFSNSRQNRNDDPLGVAYGTGGSGLTGPADAVAVLEHTGPAVAAWRDRPIGARGLARRPGFTATAVLALSIGIGATAAVATVTNALLFQPLPVPDPDELVVVAQLDEHTAEFRHGLSYPEYLD